MRALQIFDICREALLPEVCSNSRGTCENKHEALHEHLR
jgi:hypothetical protein